MGRIWYLQHPRGILKTMDSAARRRALRLSHQGYSLVELLVAVFMVGGIALIISQFSSSFQSQTSALRRSCESYTNSLISIVSEETPYRNIMTFNPQSPSPLRTAPPFPNTGRAQPQVLFYLPVSVAAADFEPFLIAKPFDEMPNGSASTLAMGPRLHSFQLIQGSIRTLATIYNRFPAVRCQYGPYAPITDPTVSLALPAQLQNSGAAIRMRIDPYRISTGASLCPLGLTRIFPAPAGLNTADQNVFVANSGRPDNNVAYNNAYSIRTIGAGVLGDSFGPYDLNDVTLPASTMAHRNSAPPVNVGDPDVGLRMYVDATYTQNGQNFACVSSKNFEYPADRTAPPVPNHVLVVAGSNSSALGAAPGLWDHCATPGVPDNTGTLTVELGYNALAAGSVEPGVQFLCKDLSWIRGPAAGSVPCVTRSGGGTGGSMTSFVAGHPLSSVTPLNPTWVGANNMQYTFAATAALRDRAWMPCDRLTVCGQIAQFPRNVISPGDPGNIKYQLNYTTLPFGCHVDVEVAAVDTAGNRSSVAAPTFMAKTPAGPMVTIDGQSFQVRLDEIYYPTCGNSGADYVAGLGTYCPPAPAFGFPNGYYTCRGHASFGARGGTGPIDECCRNGGTGNECRPWN